MITLDTVRTFADSSYERFTDTAYDNSSGYYRCLDGCSLMNAGEGPVGVIALERWQIDSNTGNLVIYYGSYKILSETSSNLVLQFTDNEKFVGIYKFTYYFRR